jgi:hypothetical protein
MDSEVSLGPAMPYLSTPCGRPPPWIPQYLIPPVSFLARLLREPMWRPFCRVWSRKPVSQQNRVGRLGSFSIHSMPLRLINWISQNSFPPARQRRHCDTKCGEKGIYFGLRILGSAQLQPLYCLRATTPRPAKRPVQRVSSTELHYCLLNATNFCLNSSRN